MLDPQRLRTDLDAVVARLSERGFAFDRETYGRLESERRRVIQEAEALKAERNKVSDEVAKLKREKGDAAHLIEQQRAVGEKLKTLEHAEREADAAFHAFLAGVPNVPHASVPSGKSEHDNREAKKWGVIPAIEKPLDHVELGTKLGILDLDRAAKLAGARFSVLKGPGAKLERALAAFMLDRQTAAGYTEVIPPYLVNAESLMGTGQLPKFEQDLFQIPRLSDSIHAFEAGIVFQFRVINGGSDLLVEPVAKHHPVPPAVLGLNDQAINKFKIKELVQRTYQLASIPESDREFSDEQVEGLVFKASLDCFARRHQDSLFLIPTAEVPVTNLYRDEILDGAALPLRHCAFTPCFRSEAGSYGKDTKGIIRQHQFHKVELVTFTTADEAEAELEKLTGDAEAILEALELPYRRVLLCTGDMGFSSQKTYDLEVWIPSQNTYREISSCSWFGDFQARRANLKYRPNEPKAKAQLLHTLNGSGLAVGRTWVAVLENYQQPDGSIRVPKVLQPFMGCAEIR